MNEIKPEVISAFNMMWGLHPGPVMLVHVSRKIMAVNEAANKLGIAAGIFCYSLSGNSKVCPVCFANKALKQGQGIRNSAYVPAKKAFMDAFWIPIAGEQDLYIHFGNNISEYVRPELFPSPEA